MWLQGLAMSRIYLCFRSVLLASGPLHNAVIIQQAPRIDGWNSLLIQDTLQKLSGANQVSDVNSAITRPQSYVVDGSCLPTNKPALFGISRARVEQKKMSSHV